MNRKWNWVDIIIIIVVLFAIIAFINKDRIVKMGRTAIAGNEKEIIFTVEADELTHNMISDLKIGDQIFSQNNLQNGYVHEINIEPSIKTAIDSNGRIKTYEDQGKIKVNIAIEARVAYSGPYMDLGGQEIKIGIPFIMKTTGVEFESNIKHIEVK